MKKEKGQLDEVDQKLDAALERYFDTKLDAAVERYFDRRLAKFGGYTLGLIGAALFVGVIQLAAWLNGYQKVQEGPPVKEMQTKNSH